MIAAGIKNDKKKIVDASGFLIATWAVVVSKRSILIWSSRYRFDTQSKNTHVLIIERNINPIRPDPLFAVPIRYFLT